jgi:hypothetical protein
VLMGQGGTSGGSAPLLTSISNFYGRDRVFSGARQPARSDRGPMRRLALDAPRNAASPVDVRWGLMSANKLG